MGHFNDSGFGCRPSSERFGVLMGCTSFAIVNRLGPSHVAFISESVNAVGSIEFRHAALSDTHYRIGYLQPQRPDVRDDKCLIELVAQTAFHQVQLSLQYLIYDVNNTIE